MANSFACHVAGESVKVQRDPQSFFAGHASVALDLSRQCGFGGHRTADPGPFAFKWPFAFPQTGLSFSISNEGVVDALPARGRAPAWRDFPPIAHHCAV